MALRLTGLGRDEDSGAAQAASWDEKRADLSEHLAELRTRIIRSAVYLIVGAVIAYNCFHWLFPLLTAPVTKALQEAAKHQPANPVPPGAFVFHQFTEPFFLQLQLSIYAGIVLGAPFVVMEIWGFVAPGLTPGERRPFRLIAPFSVCLFFLGAGLAFFIMPQAVHWFLGYLASFPGAILLQDPRDYILFLVQMLLAFGLVFQLPVIMLALGKLGIIRSSMLLKYWRYIVVAISVIAMIVTPSNDPFSMLVMTAPLVLLFFLSIGLVKLVEPR